MAQTASYTLRTMDLSPGQFEEFARVGDFVTCLGSTGGFKIAFDGGPESDFEEGLSFEVPQGFTKVRLRNNSSAIVRVRLAIGFGAVHDNRLIPSAPLTSVHVAPEEFDAPAPVTVSGNGVQIVGADTARYELAIHNTSETQTITIGGPGVTASAGFALGPRASVILTTTAAIYAACSGSAEVGLFLTRRTV